MCDEFLRYLRSLRVRSNRLNHTLNFRIRYHTLNGMDLGSAAGGVTGHRSFFYDHASVRYSRR